MCDISHICELTNRLESFKYLCLRSMLRSDGNKRKQNQTKWENNNTLRFFGGGGGRNNTQFDDSDSWFYRESVQNTTCAKYVLWRLQPYASIWKTTRQTQSRCVARFRRINFSTASFVFILSFAIYMFQFDIRFPINPIQCSRNSTGQNDSTVLYVMWRRRYSSQR